MQTIIQNDKKLKTKNQQKLHHKISEIDQSESLKLLQNDTLGLKIDQVIEARNKYGKNKVSSERYVWIKKVAKVLINPFILVLLGLFGFGLLEYYVLEENAHISDLVKNIIIAVMIGVSICLTLMQDIKSWLSTKKLQAMIQVTTSVYRYNPQDPLTLKTIDLNNVARYANELPVEQLVPGDTVFLSSGDMIPADIHILNSKDLFINESTLTGENLPVEKHAFRQTLTPGTKLPRENTAFMGSSVVSGSAVGLVVRTGKKTFLGNIATALIKSKKDTNFNRGIRKITYVLIGFMIVITPTLFILKSSLGPGWTITNVLQALQWTLAIAVALTPEMLPMVVTSNLARGAIKMAKNKVIVKNLDVMQSLGAMDILCTDKTGTLTEDEIELIKYLNLNGTSSQQILKYGYLNSYFQTGLKNNIDQTIIQYAQSHLQDLEHDHYEKVDEIPFDFSRRRMSIIVKDLEQRNRHNTLVTKGAVEELVKISKYALINDQIVPLTPKITKNIQLLSQKMNAQGLRVIAVAIKKTPDHQTVYRVEDENDLVLVGYLGFQDVPKKSAIQAINSLKKRGVDVKILTGDNEIVTRVICKKVGLNPGKALLGDQIAKMSDGQLSRAALKTTIFAKIDPFQKARIINILKKTNKTVGFLGDGINDAVALKLADVGISVDSATDIAKEASDIILLEKSLTVLESGVMGGRKTFMNIIKYIKTTFASNFGNAFSMIVAVVWFPLFAPMLSLQILIQNLLYDVAQLSTPWDKVDDELIEKPRQWDAKSFIPFALWNGPISSIFDITTFALMGVFFGTFVIINNDPAVIAGKSFNEFAPATQQALMTFWTGWFIVGTTTQILIAHLVRTPKIPFVQSSASKTVYIFSFILMTIAIILPSIPHLNTWFHMKQLPAIYYGFLFLFLSLYFLTNQGVKVIYKKIHHRWL